MRLVYIASMFPKLRETFVYNEVNEIKRNGVDVKVYSLLRPEKDGDLIAGFKISAEAEHWLRETHYVPSLTSAGLWLALLSVIVRHPLRFAGIKTFLLTRRHRDFGAWIRTTKRILEGGYIAWQVIRNGGADHIHAHFSHAAATTAWIVSRLTGIPWSFTSVAIDIYHDEHLLRDKLKAADFSVTISDYNLRYLMQKYATADAGRIHVIPHSVDVEHHKPAMRQNVQNNAIPRILSIAALYEFKGFPYLIEACKFLKDWEIPFELDVIGEGPLGQTLRTQATELQLNEQIHFRGALPQEEVIRYYQQADVFCLASIIADNGERDGIPLVIMEAMARGLPIVSTTVSGIPEAVENGVNGFLAEQRDARQLAEALRQLLEKPELRAKMGAKGREMAVERFDLRKNIGKLVRLFEIPAKRPHRSTE